MSDVFVVLGSIFAFVAAIVHMGIFLLESVFWQRPAIWRRFGIGSQAEADTMRPLAVNQGFYNLFLAVGAGSGLVLLGVSRGVDGVALAIFALLSMTFAAVVLLASRPRLWRAAVVQGAAPLLGAVFLVLALASR